MAWNRWPSWVPGLIKMGELFEQSYEQMAAGAFDAAVASVDKGFEPHQVEAAFVATQRGTLWGQEGIGGNTIPTAIGLNGIPCTRIENACPSGSDAFRVGAMAVASGVHDVVLVIGVEKMRDKSTEEGLLSRAAAGHPIFTRGETAPVLFAPFATRHMHEFGTTREMLASVAVKNHYNGARDPYAHFQNEITVDDVLEVGAGVPSAAPARLLPADRRRGRGAARPAPSGRHEFTDRPVFVAGFGVATDHPYLHEKDSFTEIKATRLAAQRAYAMAGVGPEQIDCAEVHDCFTITEILDIEDLGFFEKGDGGRASARGRDRADRPHPREHVGRPAREGPPDRRDRRRADHRVLVAAPRRSRRSPDRDAQRLRAAAQRGRPRLGRVGRQHPHEPESAVVTGDAPARRARPRRRRPHRSRPARREERARRSRCATASSTPCAASAPIPKVRAGAHHRRRRRFCAGMDLGASTVTHAGKPGFVPRLTSEALRAGVQTFIRELWELDKPTVAAVNGAAVGPGAHLALACDFVLVHPRTRFIWTFAKWGLVADAGGAYLLPRLVGLPAAKAMVMLGEGATGAEAVDLGLAYRCVDTPDALAPRMRSISRVGSPPGRRVRSGLSKRLLNASFETDLARSLELEGHFQTLATASPDLVEGMAAFREKRDAQFDGT